MKKNEIIRLKTLTNELSFALDIEKRKSKLAIETIFKIITRHIVSGNEVALLGFGRFKVREIAPKNINGFGHGQVTLSKKSKKLAIVNSNYIKKLLNKKNDVH